MTSNKSDYSVLAVIAAVYVAAVFRFQTVPKYILLSTAGFALCYLTWGVIHQIKVKNFHARIVLEYLLVAILGIAIVSTLLI